MPKRRKTSVNSQLVHSNTGNDRDTIGNMDEHAIRRKLQEFSERATKLDLVPSDVLQMVAMPRTQRKLFFGKPLSLHYVSAKRHWRDFLAFFCRWKYVLAFILASVVMVTLAPKIPQMVQDLTLMDCLLDGTSSVTEITRPMMPCDLCANLTEVSVVTEMSRDEFDRYYAYTAIPLLVKGAVLNWKAIDVFSFQFFREFYGRNISLLRTMKDECQFFAYNTNFSSLEEVFSMSKERAAFAEGQDLWYLGWSNCLRELDTLRDYYDLPPFLPPSSLPGAAVDWIFMGGPGYGAGIHVDNVGLPSWQAQVRGSKTWTLIPSPECQARCETLSVKMEQGDILLVDTNTWYHSTFIHPGDISISIGSEYE